MPISREKLYNRFVEEIEQRPHHANINLREAAVKVVAKAAREKLVTQNNVNFFADLILEQYKKNRVYSSTECAPVQEQNKKENETCVAETN